MPFGKDNTRLIPYKVDEQGRIWGAAIYSSEVSLYEKKLESRFKMSANDEETLKKEILKRYRETGCLVSAIWAADWLFLLALSGQSAG